jgi:putative ABC transport system substrate-binding protein
MSCNSQWLAHLTATSQLPALSPFRAFAEAGGLMAYGPSQPELYRRCAVQVGKILQGATPGALPMERPMRFQLALNLKSALALRITMLPSLLLLADEVLQ